MLRSTLVILALLLMAAPPPATAQTGGPERQITPKNDSAAVISVVRAFHAALAGSDSTAALRLLAPDVLILESGHAEDLAEYRSHHLAADIAFAQAVPGQREIQAVTVLDSVAWLAGTSRTTGTYRSRAIDSDGAELMVLTRTPEGWKIRAIHWSSRARRRE